MEKFSHFFSLSFPFSFRFSSLSSFFFTLSYCRLSPPPLILTNAVDALFLWFVCRPWRGEERRREREREIDRERERWRGREKEGDNRVGWEKERERERDGGRREREKKYDDEHLTSTSLSTTITNTKVFFFPFSLFFVSNNSQFVIPQQRSSILWWRITITGLDLISSSPSGDVDECRIKK